MPLSPPPPGRFTRVILTVALSIVSPACATRVITLPGDGGAGGASGNDPRFPAPFCIPFTDATGAACTTCYDDTGTEIKRICVAAPTMGQMCGVVEIPMQGRCVQCMDSTGMSAIRACLKCDPMEGDCATCSWSDAPDQTCKICTSPDSGTASDSCSQLRPELQ
jgi:hypothetical protein